MSRGMAAAPALLGGLGGAQPYSIGRLRIPTVSLAAILHTRFRNCKPHQAHTASCGNVSAET